MVVAMSVVVVMLVGVVAAAAVATPAVVAMVAMVAVAVVVAAVAGEGRGPGWRLSGSGRLVGLAVMTGSSECRGLPMIGAYNISSSGLHSESSGLGDGAASGAGERGTAPGEHEGDCGRVSRRGGNGVR